MPKMDLLSEDLHPEKQILSYENDPYGEERLK